MRDTADPIRKKCMGGRSPALMICLIAAILTGCMVGPNFQRPQTTLPAEWSGTPLEPRSITPNEAELARWWTLFEDPILVSLVDSAIRFNLDIKQAEARIRQARAARGVAAAGIGPTVDAAGDYQRSRSVGGGSDRSEGVISNNYQAGFDAGWELDIFGGVRRSIEAADADLQAALETRRDVLVTLTAEVARNYIDLRAFQQRIIIARQNLAAQEHSAALTRQRFQGGFAGGLDVANAEAQVATTAAQIPLLESSARQSIYSLSVLLGMAPAALLEELSPAEAIPAAPPTPPPGIPSDLLRRRPDIRRAEAEIHAATARIGVTTADLFPKFTIFGSAGLRSSDFGSWFDWSSRVWAFGPSASWQVFDTGRIRSNIELQEALQDQSLIAYRQTVLSALQEVENALIASAKEAEHRRALVEAVAANRKAVNLATMLYTQGQTDFLNVLDAQRSLYATQDALVRSTGTVSTDLVALFKALGGGWSEASESL
ncbi:MAG: efflux transporter outer membrane subunit [Desulfobacterales bacterium]|jgi:multidrug efflux system outer membrane protein